MSQFIAIIVASVFATVSVAGFAQDKTQASAKTEVTKAGAQKKDANTVAESAAAKKEKDEKAAAAKQERADKAAAAKKER